jgi:hypothetical protein
VNDEVKFQFRTFGSDIILNHHLFQKLKLIGREEFPYSTSANVDECSVFMIFGNEKLGFAKFGDDKLTFVVERSKYDDIIVYKGQFYVIDRQEVVSWIECSSLKFVATNILISG